MHELQLLRNCHVCCRQRFVHRAEDAILPQRSNYAMACEVTPQASADPSQSEGDALLLQVCDQVAQGLRGGIVNVGDGTRIDYVQQGLNAQFVFENPNVTGGCGCGSSFTTDADKLG